MDIYFQNKTLEKMALNRNKCLKSMGQLRTKLFFQRLFDLEAATSLEDVRYLPGHYHELRGDRKGQWACDLDQPYRLVFEPHERPIPTDEYGKYVWLEIKEVEIVEIVDYH